MSKLHTARAIIHTPYESSRGKVYDSVLLTLEGFHGKYGLPGGTIEKGESPVEAAVREVWEEFHLVLHPDDAKKVETYDGHVRTHDIFLFKNVSGRLKVDSKELKGIGFLNAGSHNRIPPHLLERYVSTAVRGYFQSNNYQRESYKQNAFEIPGYYFIGNTDAKIQDWQTQRRQFK